MFVRKVVGTIFLTKLVRKVVNYVRKVVNLFKEKCVYVISHKYIRSFAILILFVRKYVATIFLTKSVRKVVKCVRKVVTS